MITPETYSHIEEIKKRAGYLWRFLDVDNKQREVETLEMEMSSPGFWDHTERAQATATRVNQLKSQLETIRTLSTRAADAEIMAQLLDESGAESDDPEVKELEKNLSELREAIDAFELRSLLTGPHDANNAIMSIHAGAGGTESCDWAEMLFRMYTRWAERRGFEMEVQDLQPGDEAGLSRVTFILRGENAYGYAKAERGVHRLVRISPFDSNKRRHTSFCAIDIIAEIDDDIDVDIREEDLRVDTYRSSGKGGQHVNKTDSAVRLTHLPSGLVVACQQERSQTKNRSTAMKLLKARLYEKMQDEKRSEMEKFYGEKGEIGWGSQIRSYVFQPYQMVKDLRTGVETGNIQAVMDGDIDRFISAWLRAGCPRSRNKDVKMED
ncbi:MAG: peptide chain release factor 2 [Puniceicoccaceae bacterium]|nr:MAG: peptide chain release factor 2 [Puniceicoccaceae bacterium]